jgi:hypothetical protein
MNMNIPGPLENPAVLNERIADKTSLHQSPQAEEALRADVADRLAEDRDARLAGYKSPLRRLIERLLPSKGRVN